MDLFGSFMAYLMLGAGSFLSLKTGFFQLTHLTDALKAPFRRAERRAGGVTPFQAMATALGSSVGTANIAGVAGALVLGGPGALFWMWSAGLAGMATKFAEVVLAMKYRDVSTEPPTGGPAHYIERGIGKKAKPLAVCFAAAGVMASLFGTALVQSNTIAHAATGAASALGCGIGQTAVRAVSGAAVCLLTAAVILGGAKRIGRVSESAVPVMAAVYIAFSAFAIIKNAERLPAAFVSVLRGAFGIRPALGGAASVGFRRAFRVGVARGVYSNEAGVGSAPIAHAGSSETDPVRQGLLGIFEVFADTMVMCSLTGLVILTSGIPVPQGGSAEAGAFLPGAAFGSVYGDTASAVFLSFAMLLFAFTSLVGWSLYGERCAAYLFGSSASVPFRIVFLALIPAGALAGVDIVWKLGECFNYLMALPNVAALMLLSGKAASMVSEYKMFEKCSRRGYNKG